MLAEVRNEIDYNIAQPEVHEGITVAPVRPVLHRCALVDWEGYKPTSQQAFKFAGALADSWPQIYEEYVDIVAGEGGVIEQPVHNGEAILPGDDKIRVTSHQHDVLIAFPQFRFAKGGAKASEQYINALTVNFVSWSDRPRLWSTMKLASQTGIDSEYRCNPISYSKLEQAVEFQRQVTEKTSSWLVNTLNSVLKSQGTPLALSRRDYDLEVAAVGVHEDKELGEIIKKFDFRDEESLWEVIKEAEERIRVKAYMDPFLNPYLRGALFKKISKNKQPDWYTQEVQIVGLDSYFHLTKVPFLVYADGPLLKAVAVVPENRNDEEAAHAVATRVGSGLNQSLE